MNGPLTLTIAFVGPLYVGSTTRQRMIAFEALGHRVLPIDIVPGPLAARRLTFGWRVKRRLFGDFDESRANERLLALPDAPVPDVVWIEKGLTIEPATLRALRDKWPGATIVAFSPDDMFNPRNQSRQWQGGIGLYDLHVTTKSFNVGELRGAGARDVYFFEKGYSPEVHRPWPTTTATRVAFGGDVGFVGWPERERERSMRHLGRHGVPVRVWGPWPKWKGGANLVVEGRPLWDDDYARALSNFRINLGFLRHVNRDKHTTRSIEIPACGGFLLAERTDEHLALFREGVEAEFFGDDDELLEKTKYYLAHEEERARIAAAGLARCRRDGYDNHTRLAHMLEYALAARTLAA